jgi:Ca2+-binding RTX toxin-like protein
MANFRGTTGNDSITGTAAEEVIDGGDGNDTIDGGAGGDVIDPGSGNNIVFWRAGGGNDSMSLRKGSNIRYLEGWAGGAVVNGATSGAWSVELTSGKNPIAYFTRTDAGTPVKVTVNDWGAGTNIRVISTIPTTGPTTGDDTLIAYPSGSTIDGLSGNDSIDGGVGADRLYGGTGNDTITGDGGNDTIDGGADNDVINGGAGADYITGNTGNDVINGGADNDIIYGSEGDDHIIWRGGGGSDTVFLGTGSNIVDLEGWAGGAVSDGATSGAWGVALTAGGIATFTRSDGTGSVTVNDWSLGNNSVTDGTTNSTANSVVCILPGTLITTPDGHRPIETLTMGDIVTTPEGPRPIRWVGRSSHSMVFLRGKPMCLPIRIHAGALGEGLPARDLRVSPWHAVLFGQTLVRAFDLINGHNVTQDYPGQVANFYNIELDSPDIIFAEGAPVETYANHNNRAMFHNLDEYLALYGSHEPSWVNANGTGIRRHPLLAENAPELAHIRQAVLARARKAAA